MIFIAGRTSSLPGASTLRKLNIELARDSGSLLQKKVEEIDDRLNSYVGHLQAF
jgi:hypothetical protein